VFIVPELPLSYHSHNRRPSHPRIALLMIKIRLMIEI
jgi:hypothetical protein